MPTSNEIIGRQVLSTTKFNAFAGMNSIAHMGLRGPGLDTLKQAHAIDGNGAQNDNIFVVTGAVIITELYGIVESVTDATTFSTCYFDLDDGTVQVDLTANAGTNCSGCSVGAVLEKLQDNTNALNFDDADQIRLTEPANDKKLFVHAQVTAKDGATNYIRFNFTGDGSTDIMMSFVCRYIPLSPFSEVNVA